MIAKDGYRIISFTGIFLLVLISLSLCSQSYALSVLTVFVGIIFVFHFFFFRDPDREIPPGENLILSPADGRIIKIDEVDENVYMHSRAIRVCIFMSVFNAHVNRNPVSGIVEHVDHKSGQFFAAYADNAPDVNERTEIGIKSSHGKIFFKQIAGLIARRIVCRLKPDDKVSSGDRFGMIKYSSRVDLYLPANTEIKVVLKQKVSAGKTIIGEFTK
jgi:phosphatidylserine decarboxylase